MGGLLTRTDYPDAVSVGGPIRRLLRIASPPSFPHCLALRLARCLASSAPLRLSVRPPTSPRTTELAPPYRGKRRLFLDSTCRGHISPESSIRRHAHRHRNLWLLQSHERGLTMRCSERLRLSRWLLPASTFPPHAAIAPASAVAELGVVRRSATFVP